MQTKPENALSIRDVSPALWPAVEQLFGKNGACGGCFCMSWRIQKGESWDAVKGAPAKKRLKVLIESDSAPAAIAFDGDEPVGWCAYGPRPSFAKLDRARSFACDDAATVWSIPCFFVRKDWRNQGVAKALLSHVLRRLAKQKVSVVEAYPTRDPKGGGKMPDAFAWTGTVSLFESLGFELAGPPDAGKLRMRKRLKAK